MKSKYKLKIKEISMRLKSSLFLLLGVVCLLALGQMVQAEPWTDPTCAAPLCNTDGPVWVNPSVAQTGFVDLTYSNTDGAKPIINIIDTRTTITPTASLYVESSVSGRPSIYGYNTGTSAASYGGYFDANSTYAPAVNIIGGLLVYDAALVADPTDYQTEGLLYYNNTTNKFRYFDGSVWQPLSSPWSMSGNELYYSLAAGTARGVAIKSGDLTGPNDDYTLDVVRKSQSTGDRTVNGYLEEVGVGTAYANGALGAYDGSGNMVGVKGSASGTGAVTNYGGYFTAAGDTGVGVYGSATDTGTGISSGGYFVSASDKGRAVYGYASSIGADNHWGGYFEAVGDNGGGVYGKASGTTGTGVTAVGPGTTGGVALRVQGGSIALLESATIPTLSTNYGKLYINSAEPKKLYFLDETGQAHDLTAGSDASGNIADGTVTGQMTHWNDSALPAGQWQPVANTDMLWDNTNKNLGIGTGSPFSDNKLHVVKSAASGDPVAVYASTTLSSVGGNGYGAYLTATHSGTGGNAYGVYSTATGNGGVVGGRFSATGGAINTGVSGSGADYGGYFTSSSTAVYADTTLSGVGGNGYGAYFTATHSGTGGNIYGTYSTATGSGFVVGGSFSATGGAINTGVSGSGSTTGGSFQASESSGRGVYGYSSNAVDGYGGYFESDGASTTGSAGIRALGVTKGVWGSASSADGTTAYGGYFTSSCTGSNCIGAYAETAAVSSSGAVVGVASATGVSSARGGSFSAAGDTGIGVYGSATGNSGKDVTYGGYFSASVNAYGIGVYGEGGSGGYAGDFSGRVRSSSKFMTNSADTATAPGFTWDLDENTGIYRSAADTINFSTAGTERMRVDSVGNVGVGVTATSTNKLHVVNSSTTAASTAVYGEASGVAVSTPTYGVYGKTAGLSPSAGVYGEATASSTSSGVYGKGVNRGVVGEATGNTGRGVYGTTPSTSTSGVGGYFSNGGSASTALYTSGEGTGYAAQFTWGPVVIDNVSAGSAPLYVNYATGAGDLYVGDAIEADGNIYSAGNIYIDSDFNSSYDYLYFGGTTATSDYIRYYDVSDTFGFSGSVATISRGTATDPAFSFTLDPDTGMYSSNTNQISFTTAGSIALTIASTGRLTNLYAYSTGVTPTAALYVDASGNIGKSSSSRRYKENIINIEDVSWLYELQPVNFNFKNDENKRKMYGLIAEDVDKINKALVFYDEENQPDGVEYTQLITPIIQAIQTQKQQLDALETKVEMIEKDGCSNNEAILMETIEKLEARIEALEGQSVEPVKTSFWSKLW